MDTQRIIHQIKYEAKCLSYANGPQISSFRRRMSHLSIFYNDVHIFNYLKNNDLRDASFLKKDFDILVSRFNTKINTDPVSGSAIVSFKGDNFGIGFKSSDQIFDISDFEEKMDHILSETIALVMRLYTSHAYKKNQAMFALEVIVYNFMITILSLLVFIFPTITIKEKAKILSMDEYITLFFFFIFGAFFCGSLFYHQPVINWLKYYLQKFYIEGFFSEYVPETKKFITN